MSMAMGSKLRFDQGSWQEAAYDIYIGIVVGASHVFYFAKRILYWNLLHPILEAFGVKLWHDDTSENPKQEKRLKVVGVGFGRTGTYSLTLALNELNIPTLHTQHLYEHDAILTMWANRVFVPSIRDRHATLRSPDLDVITAAGFEGTMDFPMALYYEDIMEKYPECKFILTVRESSEVWFKSWETLLKSITEPTNIGGYFFTAVRQMNHYLRWLLAIVCKEDIYLTIPFPLPEQNKEAAIQSYEEHNRRVREVIPTDRLLEYDVRQGWEPLCKFLEIEHCPTTTFPKTNSARSVQVQAVAATLTLLIVVLFVVFYLFTRVFQRATGMTVLQWANWKMSSLLDSLINMDNNSKPTMKRAQLARKSL